jgi:exoribonuclease R
MKATIFRVSLTAEDAAKLEAGFTAIEAEFQVPGPFSTDVLDEVSRTAAPAAVTSVLAEHDREDLQRFEFVTLDPASSTDLDQAFCIEQEPDGTLLLHYAIADVAAFVPSGGPTETEAWSRGETIYTPRGRIPQYPQVVSENAGSLLPDGTRPAIVLDVAVDARGIATLRLVRKAVIRSRAKLAYETTDVSSLPFLEEFARRVTLAEDNRGAMRTELSEQQLSQTDTGEHILELRSLLPSETANAALSLSANLAAGEYLAAAGIGLFRVMAKPDDHAMRSLQRLARALGLMWTTNESLAIFQRSLDVMNPKHRAFLVGARRAGGGASYATIGCGDETAAELVDGKPFHAAIAGTYVHVTAPLRRLADRYVLELLCTLMKSGPAGVTDKQRTQLGALPSVMRRSGALASGVERAGVDLAEAVMLESKIGQQFSATVLESSDSGAVVQISEPPVRARLSRSTIKHGAVAGAVVAVKLETVDVVSRSVKFALVDPTS